MDSIRRTNKIDFLQALMQVRIRQSENKMLRNLGRLETRFELLCRLKFWHSSLNLAFKHVKLHNIFIFGMAYSVFEFVMFIVSWQTMIRRN